MAKLLLVEDDQAIATPLQRALAREGFEVHHVDNGADAIAANAFTTTTLAAATAGFVWPMIEWITRGKPSVLGFCSGIVAGLVVVTPACGFITPTSAVLVGVLADDESTADAERALASWGVRSAFLVDREGVSLRAAGINSLPSTLIVDANGQTLWRAPIGASPDDVLRALP